jgi:hypothetical protein
MAQTRRDFIGMALGGITAVGGACALGTMKRVGIHSQVFNLLDLLL